MRASSLTYRDWLKRISGASEPLQAARILAGTLLTQYYRDGVMQFPIKWKEIAKLRSVVDVRYSSDLSNDGFLRVVPGGFVIYLKKEQPVLRANFTGCHEVGHTFFYRLDSALPERVRLTGQLSKSNRDYRTGSQKDPEETLCDCFARELLLPEQLVRSRLGAFVCSDEPTVLQGGILRISNESRVSPLVVIHRLRELELIPLSTVVLKIEWQPHRFSRTAPELRVWHQFRLKDCAWFVPCNRRCSSIGLYSAIKLWEKWSEHGKKPDDTRQTGFFEVDGEVLVRAPSRPTDARLETITIRSREGGTWHTTALSAKTSCRLYADYSGRAYIIAIIRPFVRDCGRA